MRCRVAQCGRAYWLFCGCLARAVSGFIVDPAGYIVLTTRHSMEFGGLDGFVDDLFVRPAFRRHGVGTSLLTELFRECSERRVLAVHVEVGSDNAPAQALCRRFGLSNNGRKLFTVPVA